MKTAVTVVCNETLTEGFPLVGIDALKTSSPADAEQKLLEKAHYDTFGIVIIDDGSMQSFTDKARELLERKSSPLFLSIPLSVEQDSDVNEQSRKLVEEMILRATGSRIEIKEEQEEQN